MTCPKDKIGQDVAVGDFIAYGHALGRCAGLRIGRVLALGRTEPPSWRVADGPGWKATVIGVDDDWSRHEARLCAKTGTLFFPSRWLKLDPATLPEAYRNALNSYEFKPAKPKKK